MSRREFRSRLTGGTSSSRKQSFTRTTGRKARVASENNRKLYPSTVPAYDFLRKEDGEKSIGSLLPRAEWWYGVVAISLTCMLASIITLWAPYPLGARTPTETVAMMSFSNGCVGLNSCTCPRETICADDLLSMIFLTIARATAFFNYPLYMLLFLSKANNLNNFLQKTVLKCWINFSDFHRVHTLFGMIVGLESTSHSFFHVLRWARRKNDIQLIWMSTTGITGMVAIVVTPFIILPMAVPNLRQRISFEWRKLMHNLCLVWAAALLCHAPQRIFWLIGVSLTIYVIDKTIGMFFKTHLIESAHFERLGETSCIVSFENPRGFGKQNSAYVYIMLPWISKHQFHAFTVFPCTKPKHSSLCISKCGDWTTKLMDTIATPTHKPAFVVGPFLSPFSSPAMDSENLIAVASGIGVTPAISLIKQYSNTHRRLNLIWICRDAGLIEYFLLNIDFGSDGYNLIYYTGKKRPLVLEDAIPGNIFIFNSRPNLERAVSNIIVSTTTGIFQPEKLLYGSECATSPYTTMPATMRCKLLLRKALSTHTIDQLYEITVIASNHCRTSFDPLIATVDCQGVIYTMSHLLGDDDHLLMGKISDSFAKLDDDGDGRLDRVHFEEFINLMLKDGSDAADEETVMSTLTSVMQRENSHVLESISHDIENPEMEQLHNNNKLGVKMPLQAGDKKKFLAKNWKMLYCGGSQPVLNTLKDLERKFGINLAVEKFDW